MSKKRSVREKQKEEDKGEIFDMLKYDRKYSVAFDATIDDLLEHRYCTALSRLEAVMTEGGTILMGKGVTFRDVEHPIAKFRVIGSLNGVDVSTTFIVKKGSIYFVGYSVDDRDTEDVNQPTWNILRGIKLRNCRNLTSSLAVSYGRVNNLGSVGPYPLLESLHTLKYGTQLGPKQMSFHSVCVHFAEAVRFTCIRECIAAAMRDPHRRYVLEPRLISYIVNWNTVTSFFRRNKMNVPRDASDVDKERRKVRALLELDDNVSFTEDHERELLNNINIFLFEADDERKDRRERVRKTALHQIALIRQPSVPLEKLKRSAKWLTRAKSIKRQDLDQERDQLLNELINSGGEKDIWLCLVRALWKRAEQGQQVVRWEEQDLRIGKLLLLNTDINFREKSTDLSYCFDDKGYEYKLPTKLLSDPRCEIVD